MDHVTPLMYLTEKSANAGKINIEAIIQKKAEFADVLSANQTKREEKTYESI